MSTNPISNFLGITNLRARLDGNTRLVDQTGRVSNTTLDLKHLDITRALGGTASSEARVLLGKDFEFSNNTFNYTGRGDANTIDLFGNFHNNTGTLKGNLAFKLLEGYSNTLTLEDGTGSSVYEARGRNNTVTFNTKNGSDNVGTLGGENNTFTVNDTTGNGSWTILDKNNKATINLAGQKAGDSIVKLGQSGCETSNNTVTADLGAEGAGDVLDLTASGMQTDKKGNNKVTITKANKDDVIKVDSDATIEVNKDTGEMTIKDPSSGDEIVVKAGVDVKIKVGSGDAKSATDIRKDKGYDPGKTTGGDDKDCDDDGDDFKDFFKQLLPLFFLLILSQNSGGGGGFGGGYGGGLGGYDPYGGRGGRSADPFGGLGGLFGGGLSGIGDLFGSDLFDF